MLLIFYDTLWNKYTDESVSSKKLHKYCILIISLESHVNTYSVVSEVSRKPRSN